MESTVRISPDSSIYLTSAFVGEQLRDALDHHGGHGIDHGASIVQRTIAPDCGMRASTNAASAAAASRLNVLTVGAVNMLAISVVGE